MLRQLSPVRSLNLKDLTLKLTMLVALTGAARTQSIHLLSVNNLKKLNTEYVFKYDGLHKQNRPFKGYPRGICGCVYIL